MQELIDLILKNVNQVPKCGIPGSLVVFEPNAYPILTGDDTSSVIFAAAEFGNGRVFAVSHELYIENFLKYPNEFGFLWPNIKRWLTRQDLNDTEIKNIQEYSSVSDIPSSTKLINWVGTHNKTDMFIAQFLKNYLSKGGSVICGVCPWGWLNISHGKTLEEMSLNKFLASIGICLAPGLSKINSSLINVQKNLAQDSHFKHAVQSLANDVNTAISLEEFLISAINSLPCSLASKHLEILHEILYNHIHLKYKPSSRTCLTSHVGRALLSICSRVYQKYSSCGLTIKADNCEEFPGSYSMLDKPEFIDTNVTIKSKFDEFHCTGYYLAAGTQAVITLIEGNPSGWQVRIGSHTDDLTKMESLKRWPVVCSCIPLKRTTIVTSAFGGLIYLDSPKGNSTIKIKLESVIEAPYFDLKKPETISKWSVNCKSSGLWAELSGKHITFSVPSRSIRYIRDPAPALNMWDSVVIANHDLRGTDVSNTWRERVVVDIQPFNSQIHAGYPIVIPYELVDILFDTEMIVEKSWSLIHEIGHNMQRACWTPSGMEEAMANVFALHTYESVFKQNTWTKCLNKKSLMELGKKNFNIEEFLTRSNLPIFVYVQLVNSFGWNSFKDVFREYESMKSEEKLFLNDCEKWDEWICKFSFLVELNILPLFYFWGLKYSTEPEIRLRDLRPWLPDDEITKRFPDRIIFVKKKFDFLLVGNESWYCNFAK